MDIIRRPDSSSDGGYFPDITPADKTSKPGTSTEQQKPEPKAIPVEKKDPKQEPEEQDDKPGSVDTYA